MRVLAIVTAFSIVIFIGCAPTGYHPVEGHLTGGYTDIKVGPNMYRISFEGNAYITAERAYQYTLYRAAELAKQNNCQWFEITDKDAASRKDFAGFLGYVEKPSNAIIVKFFESNPPANAFTVDDVLKSIKIE